MENKSRVYVLLNEQNCITRIEGEYSLPTDLEGWVLIEEGTPCDRLNHAQSHYLAKPIINEYGNYNYSYDGEVVERDTTEEDNAVKVARANQEEIANLKKSLADTDYCVIKIAEGETTAEEYKDILAQRKSWRERINELEV